MRSVPVLLLLSACQFSAGSSGPDFDETSAFAELPETRVVMHDRSRLDARVVGEIAALGGSDVVVVGMSHSLCAVSWANGQAGTDYETDDEVETPTDHDGDQVVSVSEDGWQVFRPAADTTETYPADDVVDARISDDGVIVLADTPSGCRVFWPDGEATQVTKPCPDHDGVEVDRSSGAVWLATGDGLVIATHEGEKTYPSEVDLVARDPGSGTLFTARFGYDSVTAWTAEGSRQWTTHLPGVVEQLKWVAASDHLGVVASSNAESALLWLDPATGDAERAVTTRRHISRLHVSADGTKVALQHRESTKFFDVASW